MFEEQAGHWSNGLNPEFIERARINNEKRRKSRERQKAISKARIGWQRLEAQWARMEREEAETQPVKAYKPSFAVIAKRICTALNVTPEELRAPGRTERLILARHAVCYWAVRLTPLSLAVIGRRLDRDQSTVQNGRNSYPKKRAAMGRYLPAIEGERPRLSTPEYQDQIKEAIKEAA